MYTVIFRRLVSHFGSGLHLRVQDARLIFLMEIKAWLSGLQVQNPSILIVGGNGHFGNSAALMELRLK